MVRILSQNGEACTESLYRSGFSRETEPIGYKYSTDRDLYFKQLAPLIIGVDKSEICKACWHGGNSDQS